MQKNDTAVVEITDIGVNGEGIGKVDGYTLFIKDAVIGDTVEAKVMKAKKNYGYARLMKVLEASPDRVTPRCAFARNWEWTSPSATEIKRSSHLAQTKKEIR